MSGAAAALLTTSAAAAAAPAPPAWVVQPDAADCRTEFELTGASGATVAATLVSDGDQVQLIFPRPNAPERAFLPIRVDQKPFANLVLRQDDGRSASMHLSAESVAALRKGAVLQVGWLADEPVQIGLRGSEQALVDLQTCGAQVAQRGRARAAEERARALADEQLAAVKAQKAAAEAAAERDAAEAERLRAAAEAERQRAQVEADAAERARQQAEAQHYPYARVRDYPEDPRYSDYPPYDRYDRYDPPARYGRW